MTKTLGLAVTVLSLASHALAVEIEGPAGRSTPVPTPISPIQSPASIPTLEPLTTPVNLDATQLPSKTEALSPSALANAPTASAAANPILQFPSAKAQATSPKAAERARSAREQAAGRITNISEFVAKAADKASKSGATGETGANASREIQTQLTGEKEAPSDYVSIYLQGVADGTIPSGPRLSPANKPGEYRAHTVYTHPYGVREEFVNPGHVYDQAYYAASYAARRMGLSGRVFFVEATGSLPLRDGEHAKFQFVPAGPQAKASVIYVDFKRSVGIPHGDFDVRTTVFTGVDARTKPLWPDFDDPAGYGFMERGFATGPQSAFETARRKVPGFAAKGGVSFSAALQKDEATGDVDVWYKLYDNDGAVVSVNARTLEARADKKPAPPKPPVDWAAVARHSGPFALVGLGAFAAWFGLTFGLTREAAWALRLIWPVGALIAAVVGGDIWSNALRYRKK